MNDALFRQSQRVRFTVNVVIGDEAGFMMNGEVNSHNIQRYMHRRETHQNLILIELDSRAKLLFGLAYCE